MTGQQPYESGSAEMKQLKIFLGADQQRNTAAILSGAARLATGGEPRTGHCDQRAGVLYDHHFGWLLGHQDYDSYAQAFPFSSSAGDQDVFLVDPRVAPLVLCPFVGVTHHCLDPSGSPFSPMLDMGDVTQPYWVRTTDVDSDVLDLEKEMTFENVSTDNGMTVTQALCAVTQNIMPKYAGAYLCGSSFEFNDRLLVPHLTWHARTGWNLTVRVKSIR